MNWIDDKLVSEHERNRPKPDELSPDTVQQQKKRNLALATGTWKRLIKAVRADIAKFNDSKPDRRVSVSATAEFISLDWSNPPQEALLVSRKLQGTSAKYEARQNHRQRTKHEGTINLLTEGAESLSEKLLAPLLFP
jgi:hypothetical protein